MATWSIGIIHVSKVKAFSVPVMYRICDQGENTDYTNNYTFMYTIYKTKFISNKQHR